MNLPFEEGIYKNTFYPREYIDVRKLEDGDNTAISIHLKVEVGNDDRYGSCLTLLKPLLKQKQWQLLLQREEDDELVSWGTLWLRPFSNNIFTASILASPIYRPYSVFTREEL